MHGGLGPERVLRPPLPPALQSPIATATARPGRIKGGGRKEEKERGQEGGRREDSGEGAAAA
eukprot:2026066-Rhodomonas_salina.2